MPRRRRHGLRALSLFSGGGGLDLGFERAGFDHVASFDVLEICGATLRRSRPDWQVFRGSAGDVNRVDWSRFAGAADVVHGGPPCQPFSIAGRRNGGRDERDMWPAFISAVRGIEPAAFVAENVPGLLDPKFGRYVEEVILAPLASRYHVVQFKLQATDFGVPQVRKRVVFAGFRSPEAARRHHVPSPTTAIGTICSLVRRAPRARERRWGCRDRVRLLCADPAVRFHGTQKIHERSEQQGQPGGMAAASDLAERGSENRRAAAMFPPENGHFRMSVQDCALLQGFSDDWLFEGSAYQILGQIGNSVCPPVGYAVATSVAAALGV